jgi:hypothetical protein
MKLTEEQAQYLWCKHKLWGGYDIDTAEPQYAHLVIDAGSWWKRWNYWCPFRWWDCEPTMAPICGSPHLWGWVDLYDGYDLTCPRCIQALDYVGKPIFKE